MREADSAQTRKRLRKHLENVYAKLGVRTRTAAAARFLGADGISEN